MAIQSKEGISVPRRHANAHRVGGGFSYLYVWDRDTLGTHMTGYLSYHSLVLGLHHRALPGRQEEGPLGPSHMHTHL